MSVRITDCDYWLTYCKNYFDGTDDRCVIPCSFCLVYWELKQIEMEHEKTTELIDDSD